MPDVTSQKAIGRFRAPQSILEPNDPSRCANHSFAARRADVEERSYLTMDINAGLAMKGTRIAVSCL